MECTESEQVVLYSRQLFVAQGLGLALQTLPGLRLSASFDRLDELIGYVRSERADIVLLDSADDLSPTDIFETVKAGPRSRVLLWAGELSIEMAFQALRAGVKGIVRKSSSLEKFATALEAIAGGDLWFEEDLVGDLLYGQRVNLSPREGQLVGLIAQGLKNKEIAWTLGVTEGTIKVYLSRLYKKMGVSDRFELALHGLRNLQTGTPSALQKHDAAEPGHAGAPTLRCVFIPRSQADVAIEHSATSSLAALGKKLAAGRTPLAEAQPPASGPASKLN